MEVGHFGGDGSGGFEFREAVFVESEFEVSECAGEGHDGRATWVVDVSLARLGGWSNFHGVHGVSLVLAAMFPRMTPLMNEVDPKRMNPVRRFGRSGWI